MNSLATSETNSTGPGLEFPITVLLVDDQELIGEAVRRMVAGESDIHFHFCSDPSQALALARQLRPTLILQDLVMPEVDGLTLVKFYRAVPELQETPLIVLSSKEEPAVKAESFACGATDYLVKLPDKIELLARIRYHSQSYIRLLERNAAYAALAESRRRLAEEMSAAARFLRSLLPAPATEPVSLDWRYVPSADLGGDAFGYDWLDPDHLALYILDVTGHGLASALLSVSLMNVMRSRSLRNTDFRDPSQVLAALNDAFPSEAYGGKCFTIWYGVYRRSDGILRWSGGGHPPSFLFPGAVSGAALAGASTGGPVMLDSHGPMMGIMTEVEFPTSELPVPASSRLYLYTDGCYEVELLDGRMWPFEEFVAWMSQPVSATPVMDRLLSHVRRISGADVLNDDFSIVEVKF